MAADLYRQVPLLAENDCIRVLSLDPADDLDAPIAGTLSARLPEDERPYEALSYTWGPPFEGQMLEDRTITLNGISLTVTGNLYHALQRIRDKAEQRVLWVDAICINQQDNEEKGVQVRRMGKIFAAASRTIIWLGEDSEARDGEYFLNYAVASTNGRVWSQSGWTAAINRSKDWATSDRQRKFLESLTDQMKSVFQRRRYFARRWIVQEIRSSKKMICLCGQYNASWTFLLNMFGPTKGRDRAVPASGLSGIPGFLYPNPKVNKVFDKGSVSEIVNDLCRYSMLDCQDPRDRLYALLHIYGVDDFAIDYAEDCEGVYTRFARYVLSKDDYMLKDLLPIAAYHCQQRLESGVEGHSMSSWVPDWRFDSRWLADSATIRGVGDKKALHNSTLSVEIVCLGRICRVTDGSRHENTGVLNFVENNDKPPYARHRRILPGLRPSLKDGDILCCPSVWWKDQQNNGQDKAPESHFATILRPSADQLGCYRLSGLYPLKELFTESKLWDKVDVLVAADMISVDII